MSSIEFPVRFDNPTYSLAGIVLGAFVVALFYLSHKRLRIAQKRLELVQWRKIRAIVRLINFGTKTTVVLSLAFLLAMPYLPTTVEVPVDKATTEQMAQYGITVVLLMDVSYSMNYSDLKPTRLEFSKTMANILVEKMGSKDLVGFISFAGQIYDSVLPTANRTKLIEKINNQTVHESTSIGTALETAIGVFAAPPYQFGGKAIVLFSDGKSNFGLDVPSAVDKAVAQKIPIFTVSVGTYGIGESDPLTLREMSEKTGGKFYEGRNEEIENLATSVSKFSHDVKTDALKAVYDKLIIEGRDYQTPAGVFSVLLVAALFLTWFTGV